MHRDSRDKLTIDFRLSSLAGFVDSLNPTEVSSASAGAFKCWHSLGLQSALSTYRWLFTLTLQCYRQLDRRLSSIVRWSRIWLQDHNKSTGSLDASWHSRSRWSSRGCRTQESTGKWDARTPRYKNAWCSTFVCWLQQLKAENRKWRIFPTVDVITFFSHDAP